MEHIDSGRRRIVLVGPAYPYRGGIAQFANSMARGLRLRGHDVSTVTFSRQYPRWLFPGKSQFESEQDEADHEEGRLQEVEARGQSVFSLIDSLSPPSWYSAGERIADMGPDAVIFQYWLPFFAPAYGAVARRLRKRIRTVRILAVAHNILPHERRPGDAALARYFLRKCDAVAALSASVSSDARSLPLDVEIRTLSHPVYDHFGEAMPRERARERLGLSAEAEVMLFFGFVRKYKGLHVLLEALPEITSARPQAHLVVAGEFYDDEDRCRALIRARGLERRVHTFNHYIPEQEVSTYFSAADVIVQPYVSATQSGVVQTAYHFDRPVIVSDVGGLAEVVPHEQAGLVVEPNDAAELAAACIRFFSEGMSERLTEGVRREKAKHGWGPFLEAVEEMIDDGGT
jgi:glycosyltransferase involved in cell wall biosynthesis